MSEETKAKSPSKKEKAAESPATLSAAISRLVGVHIGALGLIGTYALAVFQGASLETALLRSTLVFFGLFLLGRVLGFFVGAALERHLEPGLATGAREEA